MNIPVLVMNKTNCTAHKDWWIYAKTYAVLYSVGLLLSIVLFYVHKKWAAVGFVRGVDPLLKKLRQRCRRWRSGDTLSGILLITMTLCCNVVYVVTALYRTYIPMERCFDPADSPDLIIEVIVSVPLIFFFLLRLLSTDNLILFWLNIYTLIDVFTLPHAFIECILGEDWVGFRTIRFIWLIQIYDVLNFIPWIKSLNVIDILALLVRLLTVWLTATGIIHMLETTGDPWNVYNAQNISFPNYAYLIMVTISTVGYGDITPKTALGKAFIILFIIFGLVFVAASLPLLVDATLYYYRQRQYKKFETSKVSQHVVVCGHITASTMVGFLKDFLHSDHGDQYTHVLFINPAFPNQEIKGILRNYRNRVQYYNGSVLCPKVLARAKITTATACVILVNKHSIDQLEEDNANLLRLVSLKQTLPSIPIVIQVLTLASKEHVHKIPGWNSSIDIVLCLNELKLGILAHSALCPGFSTLFANLAYTVGSVKYKEHMPPWQRLYLEGVKNEVYSSKFSPFFKGMKCGEVAKLCYTRLSLILIAIGDENSFVVNPLSSVCSSVLIDDNVLGYFIGEDLKSVQFAGEYCDRCHGNTVQRRGSCRCQSVFLKRLLSIDYTASTNLNILSSIEALDCNINYTMNANITCEQREDMRSYFPHKSVNIEEHIVLCVFGSKNSIGLESFVSPLRKLSELSSLKPIVIVCHEAILEKEWPLLSIYPDLYVVPGSPLVWANLEKARIHCCSTCIIVTADSSFQAEEAVSDKEAILCTLFLKHGLSKPIFLITDLLHESNLAFLDFSYQNDDTSYNSEPYYCGNALASSVFDSVTTVAVHTPGAVTLLYSLINSNTKVSPIVLKSSMYIQYQNFGDLYCSMLDQQCICLALYREIAPGSEKRCVITAPPSNEQLLSSDIVLVLKPCVATS